MESSWAAEHLQVIRTLMERSALYRRALAPIMIFTGLLGVAGGVVGWVLKIGTAQAFIGYWAGVGFAALAGSFFLVRRQALKESGTLLVPAHPAGCAGVTTSVVRRFGSRSAGVSLFRLGLFAGMGPSHFLDAPLWLRS